jgi:hypothetical protein
LADLKHLNESPAEIPLPCAISLRTLRISLSFPLRVLCVIPGSLFPLSVSHSQKAKFPLESHPYA